MTWTIDVSKQEMNVTPLALTVEKESESIELIANLRILALHSEYFWIRTMTEISQTGQQSHPHQHHFHRSIWHEFTSDEDMYDSETELNVNLSVGVYSL